MKGLRLRHYSYIALAVILLVISITNVFLNLRTAKADTGSVNITSPTANQQLFTTGNTVKGTAPALKEVAVFDGSNLIGRTTSGSDGKWSISWTSPTPGNHNLKAVLADGTIFRPEPLGKNSLHAHNVNSGQITQNYAAGFSGVFGVFYNKNNSNAYAINYYNGTISVINSQTNTVQNVFSYRTSDNSTDLFNNNSEWCNSATPVNKSPVCDYAYDQQSNKLYILENSKIIGVDLTTKTVEFTTALAHPPTTSSTLGYRLYIDPHEKYLYVYHTEIAGDESDKAERVDLSSGTLDSVMEGWPLPAHNLIVNKSGDLYFVDTNNNIQVIPADQQQQPDALSNTSTIDLSSTDCNRSVANLALSSNGDHIYLECSKDDGSQHIGIINTSDNTFASSVDRTGSFLTDGNLLSDKLLTSRLNDGDIHVFNTQSGSQEQAIQGFNGDLQPRSITFDTDNNKLYFQSINSQDAVNHLYTADISTGNPSSNSITATHDISMTEYAGTESSVLTNSGKLYTSSPMGNHAVEILDPSTGDSSGLNDGLGPVGGVLYSNSTKRLFGTSLLGANGAIPSSINVVNSETGDNVGAITLPALLSPAASTMSDDGNTLYVLAIPTGYQTSTNTVFAINTATLQVEHAYHGLASFSGFATRSLAGGLALNGQNLVYSDGATLYKLNLSNDSADSADLGDGQQQVVAIQSTAISPDGNTIAAIEGNSNAGGGTGTIISIRRTSDLSEVKTLTLGNSNQGVAHVYSSLKFQTNNTLVVGTGDYPTTNTLLTYDINSGDIDSTVHLQRPTTSQGGAITVCIATDFTFSNDSNYALVHNNCISATNNQDPPKAIFNYSVVDLQNATTVTTKNLDQNSDLNATFFASFFGQLSGNFTVVSDTKPVTVKADSLAITSPRANAQLSAGEHQIKGTSIPNSKVNLKVNGASIGSVTADEFGAWNKTYNFPNNGGYKITANYSTPAKTKVYINSTSFDYTTKIKAYDAQTGNYIDQVNLPDGRLSFNSATNASGTRLYSVGVNFNEGIANFYTFNTKTDQIINTAPFPHEIFDAPGNTSPFFSVSDDGSKFYMVNSSKMWQVSTQTGEILNTYDFGNSDGDSGNGLMIAPPTLADNADLVISVFPNRHGLRVINTKTGDVREVSLDNSVNILTVNYDSVHKILLSSVSIGSFYGVSATSISEFIANPANPQPLWFKAFDSSQYAFGSVGLVSTDSKTLYIPGAKGDFNSNGPDQVGLFGFNIQDGALTEDLFSFDDILSHNFKVDGIIVGLGQDPISKKLYDSNVSLNQSGPAGGQVNILNINNHTLGDPIEEDGTYLFMAIGNRFIGNVPGTTLTAQRSFSVVGSSGGGGTSGGGTSTGGGTSNPSLNPPTAPIIKTPKTTNKKLPKASEATKQAVAQAEQKLTSPNPAVRTLAAIRTFANRVPLPIVNAFPYILYILLLSLTIYYLYQTQLQLRRENRLQQLFRKQAVLAEEKKNFLELTSHYLRTPLTYIKAGTEILLKGQKPSSGTVTEEYSQSVEQMSLFIESLIEEASTNEKLDHIKAPEKERSILLTKAFWMPTAGLVAVLGVFYLIFGVIGGRSFGTTHYITQLVVTFLVIQLFYGMYQNHNKVVEEREKLVEVINSETSLDHARTKLISDAGTQLQTRTQSLSHLLGRLNAPETSKTIMQRGIDRLEELAKAFVLVGKLENDVLAGKTESISVRQLAAEVIEPLAPTFNEKKIKVEVSGFDEGISITTNKAFAELSLKTIVENAMRASKEGDSLVIKCLHADGRVAFQVIDHGEGIPKEKIDQLFKPFVRVGPVTTFNREGIGLSLYLDRLIMHSLGGEIEIASRFKHGTTATLTFNEKSA